jgi:ABC-type branched-subunit amino acid transport system ATPase component/MFS family permease
VTRASARFGGAVPLFPLGVLFSIELLDMATKSAFSILIPNIRDAFHLSNASILAVTAIGDAAALLATVPIAMLADRSNRVKIMLTGATLGAIFCLGLGLAPTVVIATIALAGMRMGQAVIFPTHNSLLADYYPVSARSRIYYAHGSGLAFGSIAGILIAAGLATVFSWRVPFLVFGVPIGIAVVIGTRLREPPRGRYEQLALAGLPAGSDVTRPEGADIPVTASGSADVPAGVPADVTGAAGTAQERPPSFGEAWRMVWKIGVLRRIFYALPFLAAAIAGFSSLASLQYQQTFHLDVAERAFITAPIGIFGLLGLAVGAIWATRLAAGGMRRVFTMLGVASLVAAAFSVLFALAPSVPVAFVANAGIEGSLAVVAPGVLAALSLAIPARARSIGFSITALFVFPGLIVLPVVGLLGDAIGFRYALLLMVPVFTAGGLVVASAGALIDSDVRNVWTSMQTRARMLAERQAGKLPLLAVRDLKVGYDGVMVLQEAAIEIAEGEIVALLGANGAGKSTLLRAIGGVVEASGGAVVFDGQDITHVPPDEIARLGIAQVPGGDGIFPTLSVAENLRAAAWPGRRRGGSDAQLIAEALASFPALAEHQAVRARNLSGGQQQMLALAMAMITRPRLLLIDELSLGLAPIVVEQLLESVRDMRARGTAILLVEQSVNVAVAVADRAYIMDSGAIRFSGPAAQIAAQPGLLWSMYVERAAAAMTAVSDANGTSRVDRASLASGGAARKNGRAALEVTGTQVRFGGNAALSDVTLRAGRGEVVGIIGPNGAGKTTLFDVISGFIRPARGTVLLDGMDVTHRGPAARSRFGLGRSFQDSRLFSGLTVRDALAVALERFIDVADPVNAVLRLPSQQWTEAAVRGRVSELLGLFGLERYGDSLVSELSTGSRRLVDLAAVVAHQPTVILLDEPSSGVAQREVEAMAELLRRVRDQLGATLLIVEHDIAFIAGLADRLVVLDRGRVLASGTPATVLAAPQVAAAFLGSDPLTRSRSGVPVPTVEGEAR